MTVEFRTNGTFLETSKIFIPEAWTLNCPYSRSFSTSLQHCFVASCKISNQFMHDGLEFFISLLRKKTSRSKSNSKSLPAPTHRNKWARLTYVWAATADERQCYHYAKNAPSDSMLQTLFKIFLSAQVKSSVARKKNSGPKCVQTYRINFC
jgi:hypothetical protein